ncbi:hypothetical protein O3M35_006971 [Rhynocoris fuscipes]|uniref:Uncharacterized protein n=1 Tax=Rhynocoris fuscipes TaxID=488301 RepID=A0AAW1DN07_9HEMI
MFIPKMSVLWTPLRLVMEENERKEAQPGHVEVLTRENKSITSVSKSVANCYSKERGSGDYCENLKDLQTLPFRTDYLRAKFQERINEENRLTTTALIERPRYHHINNKDELYCQPRRCCNPLQQTPPVDCPDDAGVPPSDGHGFGNNRNYIGGGIDSKDRPLVVRLPDQNKNTENNDINEEDTLNMQNNTTSNNIYSISDKELEIASSQNVKKQEDDSDCIVNCIYYSQLCCDDCVIL